ncbi:hypothetical protein [Nocardia jiangxiensis]|uniref:hypothetical protein n=1 Tax=Nocardia jiangxiensis TaxID=282685 RepID=UPI0002EC4EFE|nr:hypothetical protein [Nocardia jiangxiensis]
MRDIEWTVVPTNGNGDEFQFRGETFDIGDFQRMRSPWGDAPNADWLESQGVDGWMARGAGNADSYMYVVNLDNMYDEESVKVALINTNELNGE